jgi:hypothetical protein
MESFFKTLKVELVHQQRYETRAQARTDIVSWIEGFYNRQRIHSSIGYESPIDAECGLMAALAWCTLKRGRVTPFVRLHEGGFDGHGVGPEHRAARAVERHGGRVWAEGRPGQGATFHFSLPD